MIHYISTNWNGLINYTAFLLYGNLVVALMGFFSPIIFFLLKIQAEGVLSFEILLEEKKDTMNGVLQNVRDTADVPGMKEKINKFEKEEKRINKKKNLLRPRRQFLRLSCWLVVSFLTLELYLLVDSGFLVLNIPYVSAKGAIIASILSLGFAIFVIWQLLCIMIEVDTLVKSTKNATNVSKQENADPENG